MHMLTSPPTTKSVCGCPHRRISSSTLLRALGGRYVLRYVTVLPPLRSTHDTSMQHPSEITWCVTIL
jgi:hypothetical protein